MLSPLIVRIGRFSGYKRLTVIYPTRLLRTTSSVFDSNKETEVSDGPERYIFPSVDLLEINDTIKKELKLDTLSKGQRYIMEPLLEKIEKNRSFYSKRDCFDIRDEFFGQAALVFDEYKKVAGKYSLVTFLPIITAVFYGSTSFTHRFSELGEFYFGIVITTAVYFYIKHNYKKGMFLSEEFGRRDLILKNLKPYENEFRNNVKLIYDERSYLNVLLPLTTLENDIDHIQRETKFRKNKLYVYDEIMRRLDYQVQLKALNDQLASEYYSSYIRNQIDSFHKSDENQQMLDYCLVHLSKLKPLT